MVIQKKRNSDKPVTICVAGLSGYDIQEKELFQVGKSCLCNRIVRSAQDDYCRDHNSIFSTSDFVGSVINNDQFLYWGQTDKYVEEGVKISFRIVEQTEFIDDASYSPLSKGGKMDPYVKRATTTELNSPGKLMYINRDQVALQTEFQQVLMDGKVNVDCFVCVYDVSSRMANKVNYIDLQEQTLSGLLVNIAKTKKPVIVVATKCDISDEVVLKRAHQFVQEKKLQPLVECSAEELVNIDVLIQTLWNILESKNKSRPQKVASFNEGMQLRKEAISKFDKKYLSLIKGVATDSTLLMSWNDFIKKQGNSAVYLEYITACGSAKARHIFNQQAKKIRRHHEDLKLNESLNKLPEALDELLPTIQSIEVNSWKWENCQKAIKNHLLFDKWFKILPPGISWNSQDQVFDKTGDARIPFDVLQVERSRQMFDRHYKKLCESARKTRMKNEFRKVLELTSNIRPGTSWVDASDYVAKEESYKYLDERDRKLIFDMYIREITSKARNDFQELLFESAGKFSKLNEDKSPSLSEVKEIFDYLKDDERYKALENLDNARDILLFNHIALMQSPKRCLNGRETCMDHLIQSVVKLTERRTIHNHYENEIFASEKDEVINILVFGNNGLGRELEERIRIESSSCDELEYLIDGEIFDLKLKVIELSEEEYEQDLPSIIAEFKPQGYLAVYSTNESFEYIRSCLKHVRSYEETTRSALPLIVLLGIEAGIPDRQIEGLRTKGQNISNDLQCLFVDYPYTVSLMEDRVHRLQVEDAMRGVVDVIKKRAVQPETEAEYHSDIKILVCAMCGDEYSIELILSSMLQQNDCYSNPDKPDTILLEMMIDGSRKIISVTLASYHRAFNLKDEIFHGFVLVYSANRLASLATLRSYAQSLPRLVPIQILAITGSSSGASIHFHDEIDMFLKSDDAQLSNKLNAKLQESTQMPDGGFFSFFGTAWDKKCATEIILQGLKRRKKEPLPEIPKTETTDVTENGTLDDGIYSEIKTDTNPDIPFGVNNRNSGDGSGIENRNSVTGSDVNENEDWVQSSPDQTFSARIEHMRPRTSTCDSDFAVIIDDRSNDDDISSMYAKVDKTKKYKLRNMQYHIHKKANSSEDEEDDMIWTENAAYISESDTNVSFPSIPNATRIADQPFGTVPKTNKSSSGVRGRLDSNSSGGAVGLPRNKSATLPHNWSGKNDPTYVTIGEFITRRSEIESDNASTLSSKSKDSIGSQLDDKKSEEKIAPLAKPEDDEADELSSEQDEKNSGIEKITSTPVRRSKTSKDDSSLGMRKERSESSNSSTLDPWNFMKKISSKVNLNHSPVHSDNEQESNQTPPKAATDTPTTPKKRSGLSFRRIVRPKASPAKVDNDHSKSNRSSIVPQSETSPKSTPRTQSLDQRANRKSKGHEFLNSDSKLLVPKMSGSQTLDRKKNKKESKSKLSKDDLDLPGKNTLEKNNKKRKFDKILQKQKKPSKPQDSWNNQNNKSKRFTNFFGKPLEKVEQPGGGCPLFVEKAIRHIEANGMRTEGIYRKSGNSHVIDSIMDKFDANPDTNLHELGVSVHAVTGALKNFFKLLPEPLIPYDFRKKINTIMGVMDAEERLTKLRDLVNELPKVNLQVFLQFMCHLNRISQYKEETKMDTRNLQMVLYPTLLRPDFDSLQNISSNMNMGLFIQTCIEQSCSIFGVADEQNEDHSSGMVEAPSTSSLAHIGSEVLDDSMTADEHNRLSTASSNVNDDTYATISDITINTSDITMKTPEITVATPGLTIKKLNLSLATGDTSKVTPDINPSPSGSDTNVQILANSPSEQRANRGGTSSRRTSTTSTTSSNISVSGRAENKRKSVETTI